jgi:hypothetical protein
MTEFPATAHHVGLTVTDVEVSRQWVPAAAERSASPRPGLSGSA